MKTKLLVGIAAVTLLALLAAFFQRSKPQNPLGAGIQMTMDSLLITQPEFKSKVDSAQRQIVARKSGLDIDSRAIAQDSVYIEADSGLLQEAKTIRDSLTAALALIGSLRVQNHDLTDKVMLLERDTVDFRRIVIEDSARIEALTRLNNDIARSVKTSGCRVLFIPCPTRIESFAIGASAVASIVAVGAMKGKF